MFEGRLERFTKRLGAREAVLGPLREAHEEESVSGPAFTTHRQAGRSFVDNNCGEDAERILEPEEKLYGWRVVVEDGREKLVLVWPDGSKDSFERWEE